ncbi:MAG: hypothetical protein ACJ76Y_25890 [Thermoanaerobaculia bacterium]
MSTVGAPLTAAAAVAAAILLANVGGVQLPPETDFRCRGAMSRKDGGTSPSTEGIAFVDSVFPAVTAGRDGTINASVLVRSSLDHDVSVLPTVALRSASGVAIEPINSSVALISKSSVAFLPLTVKSPDLKRVAFPLNGWLSLRVVQPSSPMLVVKPLEIKEISGPGTGAEWGLLRYAAIIAAAGGFLAGLAATKWGKEGGVLLHRMGSPSRQAKPGKGGRGMQ